MVYHISRFTVLSSFYVFCTHQDKKYVAVSQAPKPEGGRQKLNIRGTDEDDSSEVGR
jgi:hypothetical protein